MAQENQVIPVRDHGRIIHSLTEILNEHHRKVLDSLMEDNRSKLKFVCENFTESLNKICTTMTPELKGPSSRHSKKRKAIALVADPSASAGPSAAASSEAATFPGSPVITLPVLLQSYDKPARFCVVTKVRVKEHETRDPLYQMDVAIVKPEVGNVPSDSSCKFLSELASDEQRTVTKSSVWVGGIFKFLGPTAPRERSPNGYHYWSIASQGPMFKQTLQKCRSKRVVWQEKQLEASLLGASPEPTYESKKPEPTLYSGTGSISTSSSKFLSDMPSSPSVSPSMSPVLPRCDSPAQDFSEVATQLTKTFVKAKPLVQLSPPSSPVSNSGGVIRTGRRESRAKK